MLSVSVNINDSCYVILTQRGADLANSGRFPEAIPYQAGEKWSGQFHMLMHTFGPNLFNSWDAPFEDNKIYFTGDKTYFTGEW